MRSFKRQQGVMALIIVSVLLVIALMLTMGAYKTTFYQLKRAQNEVKAQQAHWQSEGGVECLYAYIADDTSQLAALSSASNTLLDATCKNRLDLDELYAESLGSDKYAIHANSDTHKLSKQVLFTSKTGFGAIQTTADLRIRGSADIAPDAPRSPNSDGKYDCVAVRYKSVVTYETTTSSDKLQTTEPMTNGPFDGFSGECSTDHKTTLASNSDTTSSPNDFGNDYKQDSSLDPFKNYFNMEKTPDNIALIKSGYEVVSLPTVADGHDCTDIINTRFTATNRKLWIEGHCIVNMPLVVYGPHSLVVENGIFAANSALTFEGSVYHMVDMSLSDFTTAKIADYWNDVSFHGVITSHLGPKTIYFDNGAFHPKGGMNFDSEGGEVVLNGSYNLDYSSSNSLSNKPKELSWVSGGWYAQ